MVQKKIGNLIYIFYIRLLLVEIGPKTIILNIVGFKKNHIRGRHIIFDVT
jgi:hypothetical protein